MSHKSNIDECSYFFHSTSNIKRYCTLYLCRCVKMRRSIRFDTDLLCKFNFLFLHFAQFSTMSTNNKLYVINENKVLKWKLKRNLCEKIFLKWVTFKYAPKSIKNLIYRIMLDKTLTLSLKTITTYVYDSSSNIKSQT